MLRTLKNDRGFTLLELMMTVALLGIFFGIAYGFLNHNLSFLNQRSEEHDAYLQARTAMLRITNLLQDYEVLDITGRQLVAGDNKELINFKSADSSVPYSYNGNSLLHYGEPVAKGVKDFSFYEDPEDPGLIKIELRVRLPDYPAGLSLYTELRADRGYTP